MPAQALPRPDRDSLCAALLLASLAFAFFLRTHALEEVDFRGDEVTYYLDLKDGRQPSQWLRDHLATFGQDRQMPVPRVLGAFVVDALDLEIDGRGVRLPFALAGAATVPVFWIVGWQLGLLAGRRREAFLLAFFSCLAVAVNPFHLYWSRTAHIYVFPMLFLGLALACALGWLRALGEDREREPEGRAWLAGVWIGVFLASYSHMSAWIGGGALWLAMIWAWLQRRRPEIPAGLQLRTLPAGPLSAGPWPRALLAGALLLGVSLAPWAWQFVDALVRETYDPVWNEQSNPMTRWSAMWRIPFVMTWGGGWRGLLSVGLPTAALLLGWRHGRWRGPVRGMAAGL
ncbi:MAG: hypothetical protein AAF725_11585, partial [Acidobacteriota bacterium]